MDNPKKRRRGREWDLTRAAIVKALRLGKLPADVAREFNVDPSVISRLIKREKIQPDLAEEVILRTKAALIAENPITQADIQVAVQTNLEVLKSHKTHLGRLRQAAVLLTGKILDVAEFSADQALAAQEAGLPVKLPDLSFLGTKESICDALNKVSQITLRVIQMERQACGLDTLDGEHAARSSLGQLLTEIRQQPNPHPAIKEQPE